MGMRLSFRIVLCTAGLLAAFCPAAPCASVTLTQSVSAQIAPVAKLAVPSAVPLLPSGAAFQPFSGTLTLNYRVRTTGSGNGMITLQVTSDFSPDGGPSAASGALTYVCTGGTLGTPCTGRQTANTISQSPVVTLPPAACTGEGAACSGRNPNSIQVNFSLANDSGIGTGNYSAQITFVISTI
jgi:hypothetical protein